MSAPTFTPPGGAPFRAPDRTGLAAAAWLRRVKSDVPDHSATLVSWLVNAPGAHPFWAWWTVYAIHLRDIPGVLPAHLRIANASHEFMVAALDHGKFPVADSTADDLPLPFLTPLDVEEQVADLTDAQAIRLCGLCVDAIVRGHMSPDQDYRRAWALTIAATAVHMRDGKRGGES